MPEEMAEEQRTERHQAELSPESFTAPAGATRSRTAPELHVCPNCDSDLVYPTDWAPAAGRRWTVDLRCPNCEWHGGGTYGQGVVDRFDVVLDTGTEQLLDDLGVLTRANMEEQIERFADALRDGRILPEDF